MWKYVSRILVQRKTSAVQISTPFRFSVPLFCVHVIHACVCMCERITDRRRHMQNIKDEPEYKYDPQQSPLWNTYRRFGYESALRRKIVNWGSQTLKSVLIVTRVVKNLNKMALRKAGKNVWNMKAHARVYKRTHVYACMDHMHTKQRHGEYERRTDLNGRCFSQHLNSTKIFPHNLKEWKLKGHTCIMVYVLSYYGPVVKHL